MVKKFLVLVKQCGKSFTTSVNTSNAESARYIAEAIYGEAAVIEVKDA